MKVDAAKIHASEDVASGEIVIGFLRSDLEGVFHELGRGHDSIFAATQCAIHGHNPKCPICQAHGFELWQLAAALKMAEELLLQRN